MYPVRMLLKSKTYYRRVLRTLPNIKDGVFCENEQHLKAVNYFRKRLSVLDALLCFGHTSAWILLKLEIGKISKIFIGNIKLVKNKN